MADRRRGWLGLIPLVLLACALEAAGRSGSLNIALMPLPSAVLARLGEILAGGDLFAPMAQTTALLFTAYAIASAVAIVTGLVVGRSPFAYHLLEPTLELVRPLPKPALLPPLMLLLGIGAGMKITIVGLAVFFPVFINTVQGVRGVEETLVAVGRTFRLSRTALVTRIVLPAAMPLIFTGLRIALGLGLIVVVIAEMLAGTGGLGYLVIDMQRMFRVVDMYAWLVILAVFGYSLNGLFLLAERRLLRWHPAGESST
jgi:ABC-type nitrate/sulfonate/bicarbonate transport system permease component